MRSDEALEAIWALTQRPKQAITRMEIADILVEMKRPLMEVGIGSHVTQHEVEDNLVRLNPGYWKIDITTGYWVRK